MTPDELHKERGKTHGDYRKQFDVAQALKGATRGFVLNPVQREALDMILTKISRIVAGSADVADHWEDIAGYAMFPVKMLREKPAEKMITFDPVDAYRKAQAAVSIFYDYSCRADKCFGDPEQPCAYRVMDT